MAEKGFNPFDPLGIFGRRGSSTEESPSRSQQRQAEVNRLLADIRKEIPDEAQANSNYLRLAKEAERLGFTTVARTLTMIAQDESRHQRELQDMTITVW